MSCDKCLCTLLDLFDFDTLVDSVDFEFLFFVTDSSFLCDQPGAVTYGAHDGYWKHGAQSSQITNNNTIQPNYQTPLDLKSSYDKFQDQQNTASSQGSNLQFPSPQQVTSTPVHAAQSLDARRVSTLQIPTNPRIAPNLAPGLPKAEKGSSLNSAAPKPAYISVSLPKQPDKVPSNDAVNSILKVRFLPIDVIE